MVWTLIVISGKINIRFIQCVFCCCCWFSSKYIMKRIDLNWNIGHLSYFIFTCSWTLKSLLKCPKLEYMYKKKLKCLLILLYRKDEIISWYCDSVSIHRNKGRVSRYSGCHRFIEFVLFFQLKLVFRTNTQRFYW